MHAHSDEKRARSNRHYEANHVKGCKYGIPLCCSHVHPLTPTLQPKRQTQHCGNDARRPSRTTLAIMRSATAAGMLHAEAHGANRKQQRTSSIAATSSMLPSSPGNISALVRAILSILSTRALAIKRRSSEAAVSETAALHPLPRRAALQAARQSAVCIKRLKRLLNCCAACRASSIVACSRNKPAQSAPAIAILTSQGTARHCVSRGKYGQLYRFPAVRYLTRLAARGAFTRAAGLPLQSE